MKPRTAALTPQELEIMKVVEGKGHLRTRQGPRSKISPGTRTHAVTRRAPRRSPRPSLTLCRAISDVMTRQKMDTIAMA